MSDHHKSKHPILDGLSGSLRGLGHELHSQVRIIVDEAVMGYHATDFASHNRAAHMAQDQRNLRRDYHETTGKGPLGQHDGARTGLVGVLLGVPGFVIGGVSGLTIGNLSSAIVNHAHDHNKNPNGHLPRHVEHGPGRGDRNK